MCILLPGSVMKGKTMKSISLPKVEKEEKSREMRLEKLRKHPVAVYFRRADGAKEYYEIALLAQLRRHHVQIPRIPWGELEKVEEEFAVQIPDGMYVLIGKYWNVRHQDKYRCEYRLYSPDGASRILHANSFECHITKDAATTFALRIVDDLLDNLNDE
jgi:hypothetical protein